MALFWSFWRRRAPATPAAVGPTERFPDIFPDDPKAYEAFRSNDAKLKIWLPPAVVQALDRVEQTGELARPELLRELLFAYVYGAYDLTRMRELGDGLYYQPPYPSVCFSRPRSGPAEVQFSIDAELGKSTVDILLYLPCRLREDIDAMARAEGTSPSRFARHVLIAELFGRHYLTGRRTLLVEALALADADEEAERVAEATSAT